MDALSNVIGWLASSGILLEAASIALIVPLTSALVERRLRARTEPTRFQALRNLQNACSDLYYRYRLLLYTLSQAKMKDESAKVLERVNIGSDGEVKIFGEQALQESLKHILHHRSELAWNLTDALAQVDRCIALCTRIDRDVDVFQGYMSPEEMNAAVAVREKVREVEDFCFDLSSTLSAHLNRQSEKIRTDLDILPLLDRLDGFVQVFGASPPDQSLLGKVWARVRGEKKERAPGSISDEQRTKLRGLIKKAIHDERYALKASARRDLWHSLNSGAFLRRHDALEERIGAEALG